MTGHTRLERDDREVAPCERHARDGRSGRRGDRWLMTARAAYPLLTDVIGVRKRIERDLGVDWSRLGKLTRSAHDAVGLVAVAARRCGQPCTESLAERSSVLEVTRRAAAGEVSKRMTRVDRIAVAAPARLDLGGRPRVVTSVTTGVSVSREQRLLVNRGDRTRLQQSITRPSHEEARETHRQESERDPVRGSERQKPPESKLGPRPENRIGAPVEVESLLLQTELHLVRLARHLQSRESEHNLRAVFQRGPPGHGPTVQVCTAASLQIFDLEAVAGEMDRAVFFRHHRVVERKRTREAGTDHEGVRLPRNDPVADFTPDDQRGLRHGAPILSVDRGKARSGQEPLARSD